MRRAWLWCGASLAASAPFAGAATLLERRVEVRLQERTALERTRLVVRLDHEGDLRAYSPYAIALDEHRRLVSLSAVARRPDGSSVAAQAADTHQPVGDGVLHSSTRLRSVTFPTLPVGSLLTIEHEVSETPYFRSGSLPVLSDEPVEQLYIEVQGGGPHWRWRLDGSAPGVRLEELEGLVRLTGHALAGLVPPQAAPRRASVGAVLRYAWGPERDWSGVGTWYDALLASVPRSSEAVRVRSTGLAAAGASAPEVLEALTAFVRQAVRYVAIEVGVGELRPAPPETVLERRWGDCKDKALLLRELLEVRGIAAHLALVLASADDRVDAEFASSDQFNHVILAVPVMAGWKLPADAPVADGLLFVDATLTRPGLRWLPPVLQGQDALVVRGAHSGLVRLPLLPGAEGVSFEARLALDAAGRAEGTLRLDLRGASAEAFRDVVPGSSRAQIDDAIRRRLLAYLAGARLDDPGWTESLAEPGVVSLSAHARVEGLFGGDGRSLALAGPATTPAAALLDARSEAFVTNPRRDEAIWRLDLPAAFCAGLPQPVAFENALGAFSQASRVEGHTLVVERRSELRQRFVEASQLGELRELVLAEQRTARRRLRLACD